LISWVNSASWYSRRRRSGWRRICRERFEGRARDGNRASQSRLRSRPAPRWVCGRTLRGTAPAARELSGEATVGESARREEERAQREGEGKLDGLRESGRVRIESWKTDFGLDENERLTQSEMRGLFMNDSMPSKLVSDLSQKWALSIRCLADPFRFKFSCFNEWQKFREFHMFDGLTLPLPSLFNG
jgi:hypothetical protein